MKLHTRLYASLFCAACSFAPPKEPLAGRSTVGQPVITKEARASYQTTLIKGASFSLETPERAPVDPYYIPVVSEGEKRAPEVPYDCSAYPGAELSLPEKTSDVLEALITFWHQDIRQSADRLPDVLALTSYVTELKPGLLNPKEKIYLQNSLLHFAKKAPQEERATLTALAKRFAMTREALEELGSELDPTISSLLGPLNTWTERRGNYKREILMHEKAISAGLLYFRPVALSEKRALIAQMIAFDTEGAPHLTPLIAHIELREGFSVDAPACVIEASLTQLRKGAPAALRAVEYPEFPVGGGCAFVSSTGDGGLGCKNCHYEKSALPRFEDVPEEETAAWLSTREQNALGFAKKTFSWVAE